MNTATDIEVAPGIVRRTDRGLCVRGTRISLYLIMDYLKAGWPPHLLHTQLALTEDQVIHAVRYIEVNRESFEAEYAEVVRHCEEREEYWRARQETIKRDASRRNFTPEQAVAWARLQALKRKREAA
jgi:uncharacterized protein (DUF433 family)